MSGASVRPAIEVRGVVKRFGDVTALKGTSLAIRDNEFFTLLGPSGCGKTTLLRLIAGFEDVTEGEILLFGEEIADLPPNRRPVNTVFQHYALFPHMTVLENVTFGMLRLKVPKAEALKRARATLALVKLDALAERRPSQLSGGQQQRVALARAMAPRPKVLLLDEPLSALDLKLRQAMRVELKQLQRETGITFVFVTHDQEEALTMSDRIAVMSAGEIRQVGSAQEIYERPDNRFVADFIGETNLLDVTVERVEDGLALCRLPGGTTIRAEAAGAFSVGAAGHVSIRPERITLSRPGIGAFAPAGEPTGTVEHTVYLGTDTQHLVRLDDGSLITARTQNAHHAFVDLKPGDPAVLTIDDGAARLLAD
ncbi:MAG: ABC transporter ATP-binding protein [Alphaproteobacteria bacterium]